MKASALVRPRRARDLVKDYDPSEPRDDTGEWTDGGASRAKKPQHEVAARAKAVADRVELADASGDVVIGNLLLHRLPIDGVADSVLKSIARNLKTPGMPERLAGLSAGYFQVSANAKDTTSAATLRHRDGGSTVIVNPETINEETRKSFSPDGKRLYPLGAVIETPVGSDYLNGFNVTSRFAETPDDLVEGIVDHEMGHVLYNKLLRDDGNHQEKWRALYLEHASAMKRGVSPYSFYGGVSEGFAECYAAYVADVRLPDGESILPEPVYEYFEELGVLQKRIADG